MGVVIEEIDATGRARGAVDTWDARILEVLAASFPDGGAPPEMQRTVAEATQLVRNPLTLTALARLNAVMARFRSQALNAAIQRMLLAPEPEPTPETGTVAIPSAIPGVFGFRLDIRLSGMMYILGITGVGWPEINCNYTRVAYLLDEERVQRVHDARARSPVASAQRARLLEYLRAVARQITAAGPDAVARRLRAALAATPQMAHDIDRVVPGLAAQITDGALLRGIEPLLIAQAGAGAGGREPAMGAPHAMGATKLGVITLAASSIAESLTPALAAPDINDGEISNTIVNTLGANGWTIAEAIHNVGNFFASPLVEDRPTDRRIDDAVGGFRKAVELQSTDLQKLALFTNSTDVPEEDLRDAQEKVRDAQEKVRDALENFNQALSATVASDTTGDVQFITPGQVEHLKIDNPPLINTAIRFILRMLGREHSEFLFNPKISKVVSDDYIPHLEVSMDDVNEFRTEFPNAKFPNAKFFDTESPDTESPDTESPDTESPATEQDGAPGIPAKEFLKSAFTSAGGTEENFEEFWKTIFKNIRNMDEKTAQKIIDETFDKTFTENVYSYIKYIWNILYTDKFISNAITVTIFLTTMMGIVTDTLPGRPLWRTLTITLVATAIHYGTAGSSLISDEFAMAAALAAPTIALAPTLQMARQLWDGFYAGHAAARPAAARPAAARPAAARPAAAQQDVSDILFAFQPGLLG